MVSSVSQPFWLWSLASVLSAFLYPLLGWLFGSYTVLRWRRLAFPVLLQRLLITAAATLLVVELVLFRFLIRVRPCGLSIVVFILFGLVPL